MDFVPFRTKAQCPNNTQVLKNDIPQSLLWIILIAMAPCLPLSPPSSYQAGMTFLQVGFSYLCFIHRISYCWFFKWHGDRISFMNGMWKGPKIWWQLTLVRKRKKTKGILHWIVLLIMYNTCWIDSATFVPHKPSKRSKFHSVVSVIRSMHHSSATIYL